MIKVVDLLAVDFMQETPRNKCIIFYLFVVKRKYQQFKKKPWINFSLYYIFVDLEYRMYRK